VVLGAGAGAGDGSGFDRLVGGGVEGAAGSVVLVEAALVVGASVPGTVVAELARSAGPAGAPAESA
jgi:hypothetical protein